MQAFQRSMILVVAGMVALTLSCGDDGGTDVDESTAIQVSVTADGNPRSGVTVSLFGSGGGTALETAMTGSNGLAEFTDLTAGTYEVEVEVPSDLRLPEGSMARRSVTVAEGGHATVTFLLEAAPSNEVEITLTSNLRFDPDEVTIDAGTTVRWVNGASIFHTITPDGHEEWEEVSMNTEGDEFTHTFNTPGDFPYYCDPHRSAGMTGTITVQ